MSNYEFKLVIRPEDIYNKLLPDQKKLINNIKIMEAQLCSGGDLIINCLALTDEVKEKQSCQLLLSNGYLSVIND